MKVLRGTVIASGIVHGTVCVVNTEAAHTVPHYGIDPEQVPGEQARLAAAFASSQAAMRAAIVSARERGESQAAEIFTTHLLILEDRGFADRVAALIASRGINAEHAVSDVFEEHIRRFESETGHFRELAHDFIDTRDQVLAGFAGGEKPLLCESGRRQPVIIAARRLTPSMVLGFSPGSVLGFVALEGGITSHATILARSFNVPILFGIDVDRELACGQQAIVDASLGRLVVEPDAETMAYHERKIAGQQRKKALCAIRPNTAAVTASGQRISLKLNISTPSDLDGTLDMPHDGIGLLRTEFLFSRDDGPPDEDEQERMYRGILERSAGRPVTVRLLDISSDKLPSYLIVPPGVNPDMELRGAMALESFPDIFHAQIRALLRADNGNLRILFPMISDTADLATFRAMVAQAVQDLEARGWRRPERAVPQGIMIETPAAVMMASELSQAADFINIGSNDLVAYALAASRGSQLAEKRYHFMHPALVKMIALAAAAGKRAGREVCLCGEIAAFEEHYAVLLATGVTSFSVSPGKFMDIKCELMHARTDDSGDVLERYYRTSGRDEAARFLSGFL